MRRKKADVQLELLSTFFPNSDNYWDYPQLTYSAANKFPEQLRQLLPEVTEVKNHADLKENEKLNQLFNEYGSDKGRHGYSPIYADIFDKIGRQNITLLEIGLGTNNPALISSMGSKGRPGASLRAFRDYLPEATIFGADIDKKILFAEDRIDTGWVDQTNLTTFHDLYTRFGGEGFDVIIDDGLHSTEANLNTLIFWRDTAAAGGWIVIEDIPLRTIDVWHTVGYLIKTSGHDALLYKTVHGYMFVARKNIP